jgi:hypothetical protein
VPSSATRTTLRPFFASSVLGDPICLRPLARTSYKRAHYSFRAARATHTSNVQKPWSWLSLLSAHALLRTTTCIAGALASAGTSGNSTWMRLTRYHLCAPRASRCRQSRPTSWRNYSEDLQYRHFIRCLTHSRIPSPPVKPRKSADIEGFRFPFNKTPIRTPNSLPGLSRADGSSSREEQSNVETSSMLSTSSLAAAASSAEFSPPPSVNQKDGLQSHRLNDTGLCRCRICERIRAAAAVEAPPPGAVFQRWLKNAGRIALLLLAVVIFVPDGDNLYTRVAAALLLAPLIQALPPLRAWKQRRAELTAACKTIGNAVSEEWGPATRRVAGAHHVQLRKTKQRLLPRLQPQPVCSTMVCLSMASSPLRFFY